MPSVLSSPSAAGGARETRLGSCPSSCLCRAARGSSNYVTIKERRDRRRNRRIHVLLGAAVSLQPRLGGAQRVVAVLDDVELVGSFHVAANALEVVERAERIA